MHFTTTHSSATTTMTTRRRNSSTPALFFVCTGVVVVFATLTVSLQQIRTVPSSSDEFTTSADDSQDDDEDYSPSSNAAGFCDFSFYHDELCSDSSLITHKKFPVQWQGHGVSSSSSKQKDNREGFLPRPDNDGCRWRKDQSLISETRKESSQLRCHSMLQENVRESLDRLFSGRHRAAVPMGASHVQVSCQITSTVKSSARSVFLFPAMVATILMTALWALVKSRCRHHGRRLQSSLPSSPAMSYRIQLPTTLFNSDCAELALEAFEQGRNGRAVDNCPPKRRRLSAELAAADPCIA